MQIEFPVFSVRTTTSQVNGRLLSTERRASGRSAGLPGFHVRKHLSNRLAPGYHSSGPLSSFSKNEI
jgi:hypothetical protein